MYILRDIKARQRERIPYMLQDRYLGHAHCDELSAQGPYP